MMMLVKIDRIKMMPVLKMVSFLRKIVFLLRLLMLVGHCASQLKLARYSSLPNKRAGLNKRAVWYFVKSLISEQPPISEQGDLKHKSKWVKWSYSSENHFKFMPKSLDFDRFFSVLIAKQAEHKFFLFAQHNISTFSQKKIASIA